MRAAWFENYTVTQRLIYVDSDPASVKRDSARLVETQNTLEKLLNDYGSTIFQTADRDLFNDFKQQRALYLPAQATLLNVLPTSKDDAARIFNAQITPIWKPAACRCSWSITTRVTPTKPPTASAVRSRHASRAGHRADDRRGGRRDGRLLAVARRLRRWRACSKWSM
ncbi:MCP four helix bundle domain-containing protein [Paraburkholderia sp.]|uniref:MCP four helix bundle domain-containing protein n=1 Tax=Paraburkholderia sp. TaxID=1926495 RepID=UPI00239CAC31|nr:MCP four helix bundle domain-containing protein [Paraburkholderia sp.]MDE1180582.1 MCP four helix bundle domain-containing protein [Paraburkholderia sp.]